MIRTALAKPPNTGYTDIYTPMLGADGQPDAKLFREDMLHMTPAGYAIWTRRWRRRSTATEALATPGMARRYRIHAWRGSTGLIHARRGSTADRSYLSEAGRCGFAGPLAPWMAPSSPYGRVYGVSCKPTPPRHPTE